MEISRHVLFLIINAEFFFLLNIIMKRERNMGRESDIVTFNECAKIPSNVQHI